MKKIKDYLTPLCIFNKFSFSQNANNFVTYFLSMPISCIEVDNYYMYLTSGSYTMAVWIANRWYGFASQVSIHIVKETTNQTAKQIAKMGYGDSVILLYRANDIRLSFKTLKILKHMYINNRSDPQTKQEKEEHKYVF